MSRPRLFCLNRCLVVRKGIAEMVADASTHAVMYQVKGTRRYTTIRLPTNADFCFTTFIAYFRVFSPPPKISSFQHLLRAIRIRITEIWRSILPPMENTSMTSFLTRFCLKANQETKKRFMISIPFENFRIIRLPRRQRKGERGKEDREEKCRIHNTHTPSIGRVE